MRTPSSGIAMTKYLFYLLQTGYFAFFFVTKPLDGYVFSASTAISLVVCGSMVLTELVNSLSLRALQETSRKYVGHLALAVGLMVVAALWQTSTARSSASLGFYIGVFGLDLLSIFLLTLYMLFRGALLVHFVSGGSHESTLKPRIEGLSLRSAYLWAGGIALLANIGNLAYMLVSWKYVVP